LLLPSKVNFNSSPFSFLFTFIFSSLLFSVSEDEERDDELSLDSIDSLSSISSQLEILSNSKDLSFSLLFSSLFNWKNVGLQKDFFGFI